MISTLFSWAGSNVSLSITSILLIHDYNTMAAFVNKAFNMKKSMYIKNTHTKTMVYGVDSFQDLVEMQDR